MSLIQRSITVPNHKELCGYNITSSQESLNNFINDIHNLIVDTGISPLDIQGDIDFNNIPDLNIPNLFTSPTVLTNRFFSAGYKYYAFNDYNQNEYPIYLKMDFGVQCVGRYSPLGNLMYTTIKLDILRSIESNDRITSTQYLSYVFSYSASNAIKASGGVFDDKFESNLATCFYNSDNFYLNVFPTSRCISAKYSGIQFDGCKLSPYIAFYVERNRNVTNFMNLCYGAYDHKSVQPLNLSNSPRNVSINNILGNLASVETNVHVTIPLMSLVDTLSNNYEIGGINAIAFKTILYDKSTKSIEPNYNILCSYTSQIGQSNVKYEIELEDGTFGKYISYSVADSINYFPDSKTDFLFRYE